MQLNAGVGIAVLRTSTGVTLLQPRSLRGSDLQVANVDVPWGTESLALFGVCGGFAITRRRSRGVFIGDKCCCLMS